MDMDGSEGRLVRSAQSGDREAFASLVEHHWTRLVGLARSMVGDSWVCRSYWGSISTKATSPIRRERLSSTKKLADEVWPDPSPLGERVLLERFGWPVLEVVGVRREQLRKIVNFGTWYQN